MMTINDQDFNKEVIEEKNLPVLVDFSATWCGPCQMIAPIIEELASEYSGKIKVVKVDVDQAPKTAGQNDIMSVPTFMIFKNGQVIKQFVGARNKEGFREEIEMILNQKSKIK